MKAFRPAESAAGGAFAPGPSPALARRKTPHFAGPRPQSAARSEVVCSFVDVARLDVRWGVEAPAASGTPYRTTKKTSARFAHYRSSPLSCTPRWVALLQGKPRCGLLSIQLLQSTVRRSLSVHFRSPLRSFGRFVPLITAGLFASFLKLSKRPSATKAK